MVNTTKILTGSHEARTRWGTHESAAVFDRKKTNYLTDKAQAFIEEQAFCAIAGIGPDGHVCGMLNMSTPGFVVILDQHTCLFHIDTRDHHLSLVQGLFHASSAKLGLFFITHATRERLCVQGRAEIIHTEDKGSEASSLGVILHVEQAFFHCAKYIKTRVGGLTMAPTAPLEQQWQILTWPKYSVNALLDEARSFIHKQNICFLCSIASDGQCAVNHRGGAAGFLVTQAPTQVAPGGTILLPDYAGNGAFEAIGNIFERPQAAIVIPSYSTMLALCVSGAARVLDNAELSPETAKACIGAERVIELAVKHVETQIGDWTSTLEYEREHSKELKEVGDDVVGCKI
ncbi:MAG: pyridoxamine 5'-phosphate oxidase family protein [Chloroflexota bacterium]|nr:pyridoxamine 5'-phosphate oxidase family protein [Chloroflexota bacterium]